MHFLFKMYLIKIIRQEERHMIRILIVEDEKPISNLIRLSLTKAGYHCTCAYDGNAAVELLDQEIFDLILLDIMLPGANGFELMDYIRPVSYTHL